MKPFVKTVETPNFLHQAETELAKPPCGNGGPWPHESPGDSKGPDKKTGRKDSGCALQQHPRQSGQKERIAVTGIEPPQAHPITPENEREQPPGPTAQGQDGSRLDPQLANTGTAEPTLPEPFAKGIRRKGKLVEKGITQNAVMSTLLTEGANAALPDFLEHVPTETRDNEPAPTPTQAEINSIEKRRRRQARAQQSKKSTACFHLGTPILVSEPDGASWIPIYQAEKGHIVIQSLPSGRIEDLTGALMTKIETACTFDCQVGGIDVVKMGEALITSHHYIQTAEGWMTARQAAQKGQGTLITNCVLPRVYNLCLEGGGNIIINTTAHPQEAPTLTVAAMMGCRFEPTEDPQHTGSLTYSTDSLQRLGQYTGMSTGKRHFFTCEVWTQPNGEIILKPPISDKARPEIPPRPFTCDTITPQTWAFDSKTVVQLESAATNEMAKEGKKVELKTRPKEPLDIAHSEIETSQRPLKELPYDRGGTKEDLPEPSLTPDTYLLTRNAGKASWTQLWTAAKGTIVFQSLPSGNIEDLGGVTVTTIETVGPYQRPTGEVVLVKLGRACVTAHLHIKTEDGWMTALQAAERGHGTLLTQHAYPQLLGLCLHGGGNVLINTSTSFDKTPTFIEAATRGYRPDLSAEPKLDGFITYPLHEGRVGEHSAAQDKPSYCNVARRHLKDTLGWLTSPVTLSVPDLPQLESKTVIEKPQRENKDEPRMVATGPPSTLPKEYRMGQRQLEEDAGVDSPPTASTKMNPVLNPTPIKLQNPTHEPLPDIYLQTPKGEHV